MQLAIDLENLFLICQEGSGACQHPNSQHHTIFVGLVESVSSVHVSQVSHVCEERFIRCTYQHSFMSKIALISVIFKPLRCFGYRVISSIAVVNYVNCSSIRTFVY